MQDAVTASLVYLRPITVAAVREKGVYGESASRAWQRMFNWLKSRSMMSEATPRYGFLLDDPRDVAPHACRYEACIPLPQAACHLPYGFSVKRLPYGAYARARHLGGKVGIAKAVTKLRVDWTAPHGLIVDTARPLVEIFLDDPTKVPQNAQRIDVCLPVMFAEETILNPVTQLTKHAGHITSALSSGDTILRKS